MNVTRYDEFSTLRFQLQNGVLRLSLNRPEQLNAIDGALHHELSQVFSRIADDSEVNAVVLTGEGDAFSAGGDLEWFKNFTPASADAVFVEARRILVSLLDLPQPIIAAVNGPAVGLGATIALACDSVFAAENARFGDPHVRLGLVAGDGGAVVWPALIGVARAKEYLMTGNLLDAREAERIGLVNHVVAEQVVVDAATKLAERLAAGPTKAIRGSKAAVNALLREQLNTAFDTSLALERETFWTADHREGIEAFQARRDPRFVGK